MQFFSEFVKLDPGQLLFVALIVGALCAGLCGLVGTIAVQWRKARQAELDAGLKAQMISQGMPADDIVRILQAGTPEAAEEKEEAEY
jgi:hypothetical protein